MAAIDKRIFLLVIPVAGLVAFLALRHRDNPEDRAKRALELAGAAKQGGNELFRCMAEDEANLDLWQKNDESVRTIIAKHYSGLPDRMRDRCLPALEKVRASLKKSPDVPEPVSSALEAYKDALRTVAENGERFAQKTAAREDDVRKFGAIGKAAIDWGTAPLPPEPAPFERFFLCAVPGTSEFADSDKLFRHFASNCLHGDPIAFMTRAQKQCGAALTGGDLPKPAGKADPLAARRFHAAPFMRLLWEGCAKDAYKAWIAQDGDELLRSLANLRNTGTQLAKAALSTPST